MPFTQTAYLKEAVSEPALYHADAGQAEGPLTVELYPWQDPAIKPGSVVRDGGRIDIVAEDSSPVEVTFVPMGPPGVMIRIPDLNGASVASYPLDMQQTTAIRWAYIQSENVWTPVGRADFAANIVEIWQATVIPIIGNPSNVEWTFLPFGGLTAPVILDNPTQPHILEYQLSNDFTVKYSLDVTVSPNFANNTDVIYDFDSVESAGTNIFLGIHDFAASSRIISPEPLISREKAGFWRATGGADLRFTAAAVGSADLSLDFGFLFVNL